jgi:hypothetical protein
MDKTAFFNPTRKMSTARIVGVRTSGFWQLHELSLPNSWPTNLTEIEACACTVPDYSSSWGKAINETPSTAFLFGSDTGTSAFHVIDLMHWFVVFRSAFFDHCNSCSTLTSMYQNTNIAIKQAPAALLTGATYAATCTGVGAEGTDSGPQINRSHRMLHIVRSSRH